MRVFVTGGTGYVGQAIVQALHNRGHQVTALQRPRTFRPLQLPVEVVSANLFSGNELAEAMADCDAIIHLVGIIREIPKDNTTMSHIHIDGTRSVVTAAQQAGIKRFLHMSALGARLGAASRYHQSKWEAEEIVRHGNLDYTIFRPSVIYGNGGPGPEFLGQLAQLVRSGPMTPVIGDGTSQLQPVSLPVLCDAFITALEAPVSIGKTYELGGGSVVTYHEILKQLAAREGRPLRAIHIPELLMKGAIAFFGRFSWFPITMDQFIMLQEGNVCVNGQEAVQDLHLQPVPFHIEHQK